MANLGTILKNYTHQIEALFNANCISRYFPLHQLICDVIIEDMQVNGLKMYWKCS